MRGSFRVLAAALLITLCACARTPAPPSDTAPEGPGSLLPRSTPWTTTWASAPQPPLPGKAEKIANAQPIRLIVRTSVGGERVRVRFSNLYGNREIHINAAHIALRSRGPDIDPATERDLTFITAPTAIVLPGHELTSDAVDFALPAFADLAITFWLTGEHEASTTHVLAQQTSYVGALQGDTGTAFKATRTLDSWPFLASVDVQMLGSTTVAVFGDSTVDGDGSTADANRRWPDFLARRFNSDGARVGVANLGLIGNRLLRDSPAQSSDFGDTLGRAGIDRFESDLERLPQVRCVILRIGVNDLGFPGTFAPNDPPVTAADLIDGFRRTAATAHAKGVRVIGTTIAPFEGTAIEGFYNAAKEKVRTEVNAWMRSARDFDGVIDADAILRDPAQPTKLLAAFDSGDHLHAGDAGNERLAAETPMDICPRPAVVHG